MEESNYIKIYTGNFIVIQLIVEKLGAAGISPIVKDESESARLAGFGTYNQGVQEIYVNNDELDAAIPIVESVTTELQA